ncbi:DUF2530 domain-containing protein [Kineococcus sp. SYSU DK004]|uniref:DUF2530 domain-containing protein n=1 Tax=Kineococcus sp. SYSU DK004 TaxID=3383125 RepID=UPI003D7F0D46
MPLHLPPSKAAPPPAPLQHDDRVPVLVGTLAWALALVAGLAVPALREAGRGNWLGACVAGLALGLVGGLVVARRRRRHAGERADPDDPLLHRG